MATGRSGSRKSDLSPRLICRNALSIEGDVSRGTEFDKYAENYAALLDKELSITGESMNYFARARLAWLAKRLREHGLQPRTVTDFGCGTGTAVPLIFQLLKAESVVGIDVSSKSLEAAQRRFGCAGIQWKLLEPHGNSESTDMVFCNGVFHHLPRSEHAPMVRYIYNSLRPGGLFALWENNPWNPGTRYLMSRCLLDENAIPIAPTEALRLLRGERFEILETDFLFIFPRALRWLRWIEPLVARLPIGGQYQVLARRP